MRRIGTSQSLTENIQQQRVHGVVYPGSQRHALHQLEGSLSIGMPPKAHTIRTRRKLLNIFPATRKAHRIGRQKRHHATPRGTKSEGRATRSGLERVELIFVDHPEAPGRNHCPRRNAEAERVG